jgi:hypothetical protein
MKIQDCKVIVNSNWRAFGYTILHMQVNGSSPKDKFGRQGYEQLVQAGITAVKGGDHKQARKLLFAAAKMSAADARPWLWLSATTQNPLDQRRYLENALTVEPNNLPAQRGLLHLAEKKQSKETLPVNNPLNHLDQQVAGRMGPRQVETCPQCGTTLILRSHHTSLVCENCDWHKKSESGQLPYRADLLTERMIVDRQGSRWTEPQQALACADCGASHLLAGGDAPGECLHCGSCQLVRSSASGDLLVPNALGYVRFGEREAQQAFNQWLGSAWPASVSLKDLRQNVQLRFAYYPYWVFSGKLEVQWHCEENLGTKKQPQWRPQIGYEVERFANVLVPGLSQFDSQEVEGILPFMLEDVVEFKPDLLAGRTAMNYDRLLTDVSMQARERVVHKIHQGLRSRVELGREKRNLRTGSTNWSSMTYRLLLLPVWTVTYQYKGKPYQAWINGQTGKVSGEKPVERLKHWFVLLGVFLIFTALLFALIFLALSLGW